jgi:hypothetical protein
MLIKRITSQHRGFIKPGKANLIAKHFAYKTNAFSTKSLAAH